MNNPADGSTKEVLVARRDLKLLQWKLAQLKWWQPVKIVRMWQRIWAAEDELEWLEDEEKTFGGE